jgi:hypothetical protein
MTNEQINIAVAEACGWTEIDGLSARGLMGKPPEKLCPFDYLPNYCNDLNAMHEAEKFLSRGEHYQSGEFALYVKNLDLVRCGRLHLIEATAAERAEAFLKTLGKWEDAK